MREELWSYIDGQRVDHASDVRAIEVIDPSTEEPIGLVAEAGDEAVAKAMDAANNALKDWACRPAEERAGVLEALADEVMADVDAFTEVVTSELGMPRDRSRGVQVEDSAGILRSYARAGRDLTWQTQIGNARVDQAPLGVVAAITPWNFPIYQVVSKVGGALMAGCTAVVKPSELAPLSTLLLAEAASRAGIPPGVFNVVNGTGVTTGTALVEHPGSSVVSFTGSTRVGRLVASRAAARGAQPLLELGGKGAAIVLPSADLEPAVRATVQNAMRNSGQTCSAHSRLLVHRENYDEAVQIAADEADGFQLDSAHVPGGHLGPLVSQQQQSRVQSMIDTALASGARMANKGVAVPGTGYFVTPTIISQVEPGSEIAQNEIFGPVLVVLPYASVSDAVSIANGTDYGLSAGVWGEHNEALRIATALDSGDVYINGAAWNINSPFGGVRGSGYGRELGPAGVHEYLTTKSYLGAEVAPRGTAPENSTKHN